MFYFVYKLILRIKLLTYYLLLNFLFIRLKILFIRLELDFFLSESRNCAMQN